MSIPSLSVKLDAYHLDVGVSGREEGVGDGNGHVMFFKFYRQKHQASQCHLEIELQT